MRDTSRPTRTSPAAPMRASYAGGPRTLAPADGHPICVWCHREAMLQARHAPTRYRYDRAPCGTPLQIAGRARSEEHTSELQSLMRISYAVFCLKKKKKHNQKHPIYYTTLY